MKIAEAPARVAAGAVIGAAVLTAGVAPSALASPGGTHGQRYGAVAKEMPQDQQNARKASCGGHPWFDVPYTLPRKYDPHIGKEAASFIQWQLADLDYAEINTKNPNVMITVESKKHGRCGWFKVRSDGRGSYYRRTGTLNNRSDSIRACIKIGADVDCGKYKKEDANGES